MILKKKFFYLILFLIPIVILTLVEVILRITGYADDLNVVSTVERNGSKYYTMNQLVGKRYFNEDRFYYRKGSHDYFEVDKSPNTVRVFLFGESTTAGFPYEYNAIPSEFLRDRLVNSFPGKRIEVINTAIAATNSFTVLQFAKDLVNYKPDLFIFYMGQNEFYGVYGVGSTISVGKNRWIIKTYLWLQQFNTFLLLKNIINSASNLISPAHTKQDHLLMEQMAKNNAIGYNSKDYKIALNTFNENYKEIIETAKENNIPVIVSTLVTNEKDLPPFISMNSGSINNNLKAKYKEYFNLGIVCKKENKYWDAVKYFKKAITIDSMPADLHYGLAQCYYNLHEFELAEHEFTAAKDLDCLRFRAPSAFNFVIRNLSKRYNIPLADIDKDFRDISRNNIIGNELLIDHLHPNVRGYFLLAKSWAQTIKRNKLLGLASNLVGNDSLLWRNFPVTYLDSLIGELKIMELESRPPFVTGYKGLKFKPTNSIDSIAYQYTVHHQFSWGVAHLNAAKEYLAENHINDALKVYKAILITDDENPFIITMAGDMYFKLNLFPEAEKCYLSAFSYSDNSYIKYKLGCTELYLGKPKLSIEYLKDCLVRNSSSFGKLSNNIIREINYNLSLAYTEVKDYPNAVNKLRDILMNNPSDNEAKSLLEKVNLLREKH